MVRYIAFFITIICNQIFSPDPHASYHSLISDNQGTRMQILQRNMENTEANRKVLYGEMRYLVDVLRTPNMSREDIMISILGFGNQSRDVKKALIDLDNQLSLLMINKDQYEFGGQLLKWKHAPLYIITWKDHCKYIFFCTTLCCIVYLFASSAAAELSRHC